MTPIGPDEIVDEADVINVELPDGTVRRYHRRKMGLDNMRNGKLGNNFIQGAVRWVDGFKALGWVLGILFGFLLIVTQWVIVPQLEKKIDAAAKSVAKPLDDRLVIMEKLYAAHLLDVAERSRNYMTRDEVLREFDDLRQEIHREPNRR